MAYRLLAVSSLLLNFLLLLPLLWHQEPERGLLTAAASFTENAETRDSPPAARPLDCQRAWSSISEGFYPSAMIELRRQGFPEPIIADIIIGAINRRYSSNVLALRRAPWSFWKSVQRRKLSQTDLDLVREREARALEKQRNRIVQEVLGIDWSTVESNITGRPDALERFTQTFSAAARSRAQAILSEYDELEREVIRGAGGTLGLPERFELDRLYQQKIQKLAQFLTPRELEDYEVRASPTAEQMKQIGLVGFDPTEEEFRAIFRVRKAFDEQDGISVIHREGANGRQAVRAAHDLLEDQLRQVLGEKRYVDYRRCQDYTFRGLVELSDQFDLPSEAATHVHDLRENVLKRQRDLAQDPSLTPEQRQANFQQIHRDAEGAVRELLGEVAYRRYTELEIGAWIAEIEQP